MTSDFSGLTFLSVASRDSLQCIGYSTNGVLTQPLLHTSR